MMKGNGGVLMIRGWKRPLAAVVLGTVLVFGGVGTMSWSQPNVAVAASESMRNVVSVSGVGSLELEPDIAYVNLGVITNAATAAKAQEANAAAFSKVYQVLTEKYGIDEKAIKTIQFTVQPQYQYKENQEPKIVSYNAEHLIQVTYKDLEKIGNMIDDASKAGANRIDNISFDVEDKTSAEATALSNAVAHAKKKAEALAKAGGRQLGAVITIVENSSDYNPVRVSYNKDMAESAQMNVASAPQGGQVKLDVHIQVDFELK